MTAPVLLAIWLVSLTSDREVPGSIPTGSRFFCAVTRGTGYSWPGMRVKCILYTVGYIILGRNARLYSDVKLKYLYLYLYSDDVILPNKYNTSDVIDTTLHGRARAAHLTIWRRSVGFMYILSDFDNSMHIMKFRSVFSKFG